jgi:hypothetical protein
MVILASNIYCMNLTSIIHVYLCVLYSVASINRDDNGEFPVENSSPYSFPRRISPRENPHERLRGNFSPPPFPTGINARRGSPSRLNYNWDMRPLSLMQNIVTYIHCYM